MRALGINWLAVLAAAIAIYVIGFVIYGLLFPEETEAVASARMPFGVVMPLMTAIFLGILVKWGSVGDAAAGARWGAVVALASAVPAMLYGWVYGAVPTETTLIDSAHLLLGHVVAGTILGGWK